MSCLVSHRGGGHSLLPRHLGELAAVLLHVVARLRRGGGARSEAGGGRKRGGRAHVTPCHAMPGASRAKARRPRRVVHVCTRRDKRDSAARRGAARARGAAGGRALVCVMWVMSSSRGAPMVSQIFSTCWMSARTRAHAHATRHMSRRLAWRYHSALSPCSTGVSQHAAASSSSSRPVGRAGGRRRPPRVPVYCGACLLRRAGGASPRPRPPRAPAAGGGVCGAGKGVLGCGRRTVGAAEDGLALQQLAQDAANRPHVDCDTRTRRHEDTRTR